MAQIGIAVTLAVSHQGEVLRIAFAEASDQIKLPKAVATGDITSTLSERFRSGLIPSSRGAPSNPREGPGHNRQLASHLGSSMRHVCVASTRRSEREGRPRALQTASSKCSVRAAATQRRGAGASWRGRENPRLRQYSKHQSPHTRWRQGSARPETGAGGRTRTIAAESANVVFCVHVERLRHDRRHWWPRTRAPNGQNSARPVRACGGLGMLDNDDVPLVLRYYSPRVRSDP